MDNNQEQPGQSVWPSNTQSFQVSEASSYTSSSPSFPTQSSSDTSFPSGSQYPDSQFQLAQGNFALQQQDIYQPSTSNYERVSPVDDYQSAAAGHSANPLQSFGGFRADGSHLLQVQRAPVISAYSVQVMLDGQPRTISIPARVASPQTTMSRGAVADTGGATQHGAQLIQLNQPGPSSYSHMNIAPSRPSTSHHHHHHHHHQHQQQHHHLSLLASNSQVSGLQFTAAESTTGSEATPLIVQSDQDSLNDADTAVSSLGLALHNQVPATPKNESYPEADTTQEDNDEDLHHHHHHHHQQQHHHHQQHHQQHHHSAYQHHMPKNEHSDFPEAESSQDSPLGGSSGIDSSALDSTMGARVNAAAGMSHMDSTVDDTTLGSSGMSAAMLGDTHVTPGTSGIDTRMLASQVLADMTMGDADMETGVNTTGIEVLDDAGHSSEDDLDVGDSGQEEEDKENQLILRKSDRIAGMEHPFSPEPRAKYISRPYNTNELWCQDCMQAYSMECPKHRMQAIGDKLVLSRAWASLPTQLQIFRLGETADLGVFAKKPIPRRTQFGPYVAELVDVQEHVARFPLMVERDGVKKFLEASDENWCNWMMFVRPAENYGEQNLVAYQHGPDIFFATIKNIEPKQELKVWYAHHFAERVGLQVHMVSEEDMEALDEADNKWPCFECNKRFKTSTLLQKHLLVHEEAGTLRQDPDEDFTTNTNSRRNKRKPVALRATAAAGFKRSRGRPPAKPKEGAETTGLQAWKKKRATMYLNKYLKNRKNRGTEAEAVKRPIKSLYKKKGGSSGINEWVCTHCDLTFDNSNLLNLHTLTHAAEDVGLDEIRKFAGDITTDNGEGSTNDSEMGGENGDNIIGLEHTMLECPVCRKQFYNKRDLIEHASEHGKAKSKSINPNRPYKCDKCWKAFSVHERLQKHMMCHGDDDAKPLQCEFCYKRFMNNSALACHLKTHSDKKYYECPICHEGYDQIVLLKAHAPSHMVNGIYMCPDCHKTFEDYNAIRKHMRAFHSEKRYPCPNCDKIFPRPDKLKLHMLRHSAHREFMCETCGRQFKRKDKLKEHMKRMHTAEREARMLLRPPKPVGGKKFIPKVSPSDYHRFIYKCHTCLLGFKRRGMLVNHLAKRHPDVKPESVPELNLPILKTQRDYFCQYCEKIYKSSSKRKAHIIKNHPGADLPASSRRKDMVVELPGLPNPTYSTTVGSVTTVPHPCEFCHKQYASKAKLMQHQRKKHMEMVPHLSEKRKVVSYIDKKVVEYQQQPQQQQMRFDNTEVITVPVALAPQGAQAESLPAADLLTQAMTELTQSLNDYRSQTGTEYQIQQQRVPTQSGAPALVQALQAVQAVTPNQPTPGPSTIELSHLGQPLAHTHFQVQASPGQQQVPLQVVGSSSQQVLQQQTVSLVTTTAGGQTIPLSLAGTVPVSVGGHTAFIPRNWATNYPTSLSK